MNHSIDRNALEQYIRQFADTVTRQTFLDKNRVSGQEILKVTPVEQVNYFILFKLFENWKKESSKLRSPYFDYESDEVKKAIQSFLDTLSYNISVPSDHFKDLVREAVYSTVELVSDPYHFYKAWLAPTDKYLDIDQLKDKAKYIKLNKSIIQEVIDRWEAKRPQGNILGEEIIYDFTQIFQTRFETLYPLDAMVADLKKVVEVGAEDILLAKVPTYKPELEVEKNPAPVRSTPLYADDEDDDDLVESNTFNSKFQKETVTINDRLKSGTTVQLTLNDVQVNKMSDLRSGIGINQKFKIINELFEGNRVEFDFAISEMDAMDDLQTAKQFLLSNYSKRYNWDKKLEEVERFMDLLDRRF